MVSIPLTKINRIVRWLVVFSLFVVTLNFASAKKLPVEVTGLKIDITNPPPEWKALDWTTRGGNIYIIYSGELYDDAGEPRVFKIDIKFDGQDGYKIKKVADTTYDDPVASHTEENFQLSAAASEKIPFTLVGDENTMSCLVHIFSADIVPDYNRDGKIDKQDRTKVKGSNPWRWWINDDNDKAAEERRDEGNDEPGQGLGSQDGYDLKVDGVRDLLDFFPLHLDLKQALEKLPSSYYEYSLKHSEGAVKFFEFSESALDESDLSKAPHTHLRHIERARSFKENGLKLASAAGVELSKAVLDSFKKGKGVLICEAVRRTEQPLVLEIRRRGSNSVISEIKFHVKFTSVEDMYRTKYFSPNDPEGGNGGGYAMPANPVNWRDEDRNGKHFILVHGYNVNRTQSHGWFAEFFKRLFWSGSNAMFTGINWVGNESQVGSVAPDYWDNVLNAFQSSQDVAAFVNALPGMKSIAAHSLGNMVVGSAISDHGLSVENYFMIDAAVAIESYEYSFDDKMRPTTWSGYDSKLWATHWHELFPATDGRSKLTWRLRFRNIPNAYNFYSSEEEVLRNGTGSVPSIGATRSWVYQEMSKGFSFASGGGIVDNGEAGWAFNFNNITGGPYSEYNPNTRQHVMFSPTRANAIPEENLKTATFFKRFNNDKITKPNEGSAEAAKYDVRANILAQGIPAYSFAAGANLIGDFGQFRNQNMVDLKTDADEWPIKKDKKEWLHSDIRDVGYLHTYQVFDQISKDIAELNQ